MGLCNVVRSAFLTTALLYPSPVYSQSANQVPDQTIAIKDWQIVRMNIGIEDLRSSEMEKLDPDFFNVMRQVNHLHYGNYFDENGRYAKALSPGKIAEKLAPQLHELINRFDFGRKYEVRNVFNYGDDMVVSVKYPESENIAAEPDYVILSPLKISFTELEPRQSKISGYEGTRELVLYWPTNKTLEQSLEPVTYKKLPLKSITPQRFRSNLGLQQVIEEIQLLRENAFVMPPLPDDLLDDGFKRREAVDALINEYIDKERYVGDKKRDLFLDLIKACNIDAYFLFSPVRFITTQEGGVKVDLAVMTLNGDVGSYQENGDALYISKNKLATLVYSDRKGETKVKRSRCNLRD